MRRSLKKLLLPAPVIAVLLWLVFPGISATAGEPSAQVLTIRPEKISRSGVELDDLEFNPERDPFNWPPSQLKKFIDQEKSRDEHPFDDLKLTGIIFNSSSPLAVINKRLLKIGDGISGIKVADIQADRVILQKSGLTHMLRMEEKIINLNTQAETH